MEVSLVTGSRLPKACQADDEKVAYQTLRGLLPDFYSGATGLSGCFVSDFLSGAYSFSRRPRIAGRHLHHFDQRVVVSSNLQQQRIAGCKLTPITTKDPPIAPPMEEAIS